MKLTENLNQPVKSLEFKYPMTKAKVQGHHHLEAKISYVLRKKQLLILNETKLLSYCNLLRTLHMINKKPNERIKAKPRSIEILNKTF